MTKSPWATSKWSVRTMRNPVDASYASLRRQERAGAEPRPRGRRPRTVRRAWSGSTQEPAGVVGAERPHSPSLNRRDPSRPRPLWPQVAVLGCPGAAKPITGGPGKWWSAERKSEEAIAVAMIGGTREPGAGKGLYRGVG